MSQTITSPKLPTPPLPTPHGPAAESPIPLRQAAKEAGVDYRRLLELIDANLLRAYQWGKPPRAKARPRLRVLLSDVRAAVQLSRQYVPPPPKEPPQRKGPAAGRRPPPRPIGHGIAPVGGGRAQPPFPKARSQIAATSSRNRMTP